ncbi:MAG TPA: hypothetical protein DIC64_03160 [Alphaproteobacteria bacterium]|nr:hypothetical protein [Alphaproteobacteria bacterium]
MIKFTKKDISLHNFFTKKYLKRFLILIFVYWVIVLLCEVLVLDFDVTIKKNTNPSSLTSNDNLYFDNIENFIKFVQKDTREPKILVFAHFFDDRGEPLILMKLALTLKKMGYNVYAMGIHRGKNEIILRNAGIPYLVDGAFVYASQKEHEKLFKEIDVAVINNQVLELYSPVYDYKVIWWYHGSLVCPNGSIIQLKKPQKYWQDIDKHTYMVTQEYNDLVTITEKQIESLSPCREKKMELIRNTVSTLSSTDSKDLENKILEQMRNAKEDGKIIFSTIGYLNPIKAQDILAAAIKLLPISYLHKAEFFFIGAPLDYNFLNELKREVAGYENIHITGSAPHAIIGNIYDLTDMLIVPSRTDASPLVVQEAAEHKVPAIITQYVGSKFITKDSSSGFIVNLDAKEIAKKIEWAIDHPEKIKKMGLAARKNYDKTSSEQEFAKRWSDKIDRKLKEVADYENRLKQE